MINKLFICNREITQEDENLFARMREEYLKNPKIMSPIIAQSVQIKNKKKKLEFIDNAIAEKEKSEDFFNEVWIPFNNLTHLFDFFDID